MPSKPQPLYEADLKIAYCTFELLINDVPSAQQDVSEGSSWHDWPINGEILQSGLQTLELRMLPPKGATTISPKAQAEMTIYETDADDEDKPRKTVYQMAQVTFGDNAPLPIYAHKGVFRAAVPYVNTGWAASIDLRKEPKDELLRELRLWNRRLLNIYVNADAATYERVYGGRLAELDKAFYFDEAEAAESAAGRFHSGFKDLTALPDEAYELVFYAEGKLAGLKLPYKPPGFVFEPRTKDEDSLGITLTTLFHRRAKGLPLEIIR